MLTMTRINENGAPLEAKTAWSVLVVYEDAASREQAIAFCDQLVKRFWAKFEFDVSWWSFDLLQDEATAAETAAKAAGADLIVVSCALAGEFPSFLMSWFEGWFDRRGDREGILADLTTVGETSGGLRGNEHAYLRRVARRAGMDYLTQLPQSISLSISESPDSYTERAAQVTSVLDEILHHPAPPQPLT
jgi:hypothetical protein